MNNNEQLLRACENAFCFLTNVNAIDLDTLVESLVVALAGCDKYEEAELRRSAKAIREGAAGVGCLFPTAADVDAAVAKFNAELERSSIDSAVNRPVGPIPPLGALPGDSLPPS